MDPLSIIASTIAIIGAGGQAAKAIRKLASLKGAPDLILALNNEINDLHLVVVAIQDVFERQQTSGVPFPGNRAGEINVDTSITKSLTQAKDKVLELEALYKRLNISIPGSSAEFKKIAWLREQKRVKKMHEDLKSVRLKLAGALGILNSSMLIRLESGVHGLRNQIGNLHTNQQQDRTVGDQRATQQGATQQNLYNEIGRLQMLHQNSETAQDQRLLEQRAFLQEPIARFATSQQRVELRLDNIEAAVIASGAESEARATVQSSAPGWASPTQTDATRGVQISASISHYQCEDSCSCICHRRYAWKTPRLLNRFLGILFVGYTGIPYISPRCNTQDCMQRSNPMTIITYLFPSWLLARVLVLAVRLSSIGGIELKLRVPHVVSNSSIIFDLCIRGDVEGVKGLLRRGLSSPFDVSINGGRTPLFYASQGGHLKLCQLLLHAGADPYLETFNGQNANGSVWINILSDRWDAKLRERFRALFPGEEFFEKQEFSLLHKTVLGLNPLPLESFLISMTKSMIDVCDAGGRTALWWAARRSDYTTLSSLIKYGADVNKRSKVGSSPLDLAIFCRDDSCTKLLLEHGSEVTERDYQGWLPLHSCSYYGCDLYILDIVIVNTRDINLTTSDSIDTALMVAVQENQVEICGYLISHNANLDMINCDGESALHYALRFQNNKPLELLFQHRANPHLKTYAGETLLHYAAQFGDLECLEILHSFDLSGINIEDKVTKSSPLHTLKNLKGLTALQIAEQKRNESLEWLAMFRKLIRGVEFPESKIADVDTHQIAEVEEFEDALESQG